MRRAIKNITKFNLYLQIIADIIAVALSYTLQYYIRFSTGAFSNTIRPSIYEFILGIVLFIAYWLLLMFFSGMYKDWYQRSPFDEIFALLRTNFIGTFILVFILFYPSNQSLRLLFVLYFIILSFLTVFFRYLVKKIEKKLRFKGIISIPVIIIGDFNRAKIFYNKIISAPNWGYNPLGIVLINNEENNIENKEYIENSLILGYDEDLENVINKYMPSELIIASQTHSHEKLLKIREIAEYSNVKIKIEPDLYEIFTGSVKTHFLYGIPLIEISGRLMKPLHAIMKRIFDVIFSFIVLLIGLPLWILIACLVVLDSKGGVFFVQPRVGKNGKVFNMYKFRSMISNAPKQNTSWTIVNDPRVTKFGKIIRKTHLDEIPQFINVLIGDMSVVGPRPETKSFVDQFSIEVPTYRRRLIVHPGITGWWQVKYTTYELSIEEIKNRLKDDFYYIENMSIRLDIEIIIRTVWCVIKGHGQT